MSNSVDEAKQNTAAAKGSVPFKAEFVPLKRLFLDPNNYRFIDDADYVSVPDEKRLDAQVQKRTTGFILGDGRENVKDLIQSFSKNGWLPVDQIQAKRLPNDDYLVVEGNRRVATLKFLEQQYREKSIDLGSLDPAIFDAVPIVIYPDADEAHHLILMGLKHISGNKKWPTINQAQLMKALGEHHGMSPEDICKALAISRREYNLSQRALVIVELYKKSEYGDQFRSEKYNIFREIVNVPALRDWIQWDEGKWSVGNVSNLTRIFSLVSEETVTEAGSEDDEEQAKAELKREPAITTGAQMREFGKVVGEPEAVATLESTRSLSQAMMGAGILVQNQIKRSLELAEDSAGTLFAHLSKVKESDVEKAMEVGRKLLNLGAAINEKMAISIGDDETEREPINLALGANFRQFSSLELVDYKAHKQLVLKDLGRINIFAGPNNSGKTSVLEAVYLLTQQSESRALMEIVSRRGKLGRKPLPKLLYKLIPPLIRVSGVFDGQNTDIEAVLDKDSQDVADKSGYVGSILMKSKYASHAQNSATHLFDKRDPQRSYSKNPRVLCRSILSSPFSMHDPLVLVRVHEQAMERGGKEKAISFLREWADTGLKNIELANEFQRFWVSHSDPSRNLDLTDFGEGMQRVFMIALVFAYAENGVVLIDELENALHISLLRDFSRFLHELAIAFNVQVFATSHSKECIDAFVTNGYKLDEVSAYALVQREGKTVAIHRSGPDLAELLEIGDVDIRRSR